MLTITIATAFRGRTQHFRFSMKSDNKWLFANSLCCYLKLTLPNQSQSNSENLCSPDPNSALAPVNAFLANIQSTLDTHGCRTTGVETGLCNHSDRIVELEKPCDKLTAEDTQLADKLNDSESRLQSRQFETDRHSQRTWKVGIEG